MNLIEATDGVRHKFPEAKFSMHQSGDSVIVDEWEHDTEPTPNEVTLQMWYDEWILTQDYAKLNFDQKVFFGRLIQEFSPIRWMELSKLGIGWTMQQLITYPNWAGFKSYAETLISDETITVDDAMIINTCLLEQGINLEDI